MTMSGLGTAAPSLVTGTLGDSCNPAKRRFCYAASREKLWDLAAVVASFVHTISATADRREWSRISWLSSIGTAPVGGPIRLVRSGAAPA
jgi:hypothetical protein